ncbi:heparinase II/III-family protein [Rhizobium sp. NRK18]|uniref:heparinase II/III family protein n=1 Tax=Rhizobium sp. NRK18 TaxID=2964667 RepID=UPI0021C424F8|nr:heparinase II/III-family protein [Rhizobium sp. NRK18]MCQ2004799.1 heparinase II/III-family protein [Rhizobium sp. NRK18]
MKLSWYFNRLRSMDAGEVLHRIGDAGRKAISRHHRNGWQHYRAARMQTVFAGLAERLAQASPAQRGAIAHGAEEALSGRFSALGRSWPVRTPDALFPASLWRLDPVSGTLWPGSDTYTYDIDYRHDRTRGDIKYVWEIGRLQQLPVLAAHAVITGDGRAIGAIETAVESWHAANPPFRGVAWASGIEVALRSISLILTHDILQSQLSEPCRRQIREICAASAYWLPRFPSRFSSANNHLVAELAGEYLLGLALGQPTEVAQRQLAEEAVKQILPDGSAAEQSPTYGAFTAEFILLCMAAAREGGQSFGAAVEQRLASFADFIGWLPEGAGFGDDDEGRVVTLGEEACYATSVAQAINGFLGGVDGEGDFRSIVTGGKAGALKRPGGLKVFIDGSLSLWRGPMAGRQIELTFDHGPLGYLSIAAHGHADALSLTLRSDGEPVLVDPGTFLYGSGGVWRNWFRSTCAHNTLNIGGADQSIMSGAFNWSHKAKTALIECKDGPSWSITAEHDGYLRRFGAVHRRRIRRAGETIIVTDWLNGGPRDAELVFQVAPGLRVATSGRMAQVAKDEHVLLEMTFPSDTLTILSGGETPGEGGWVATRFGIKLPAARIAWRGKVGPDGVETILKPVSGL